MNRSVGSVHNPFNVQENLTIANNQVNQTLPNFVYLFLSAITISRLLIRTIFAPLPCGYNNAPTDTFDTVLYGNFDKKRISLLHIHLTEDIIVVILSTQYLMLCTTIALHRVVLLYCVQLSNAKCETYVMSFFLTTDTRLRICNTNIT